LQTSAHRSLATVMRPASLQGAVMTWNRELGLVTVHDTVFATIEFEGGFAHDEGGCPAGQQLVVPEHGSLTVSIWRCSRGRRGGDRRSGPGLMGRGVPSSSSRTTRNVMPRGPWESSRCAAAFRLESTLHRCWG
jgi:hypothetical protein